MLKRKFVFQITLFDEFAKKSSIKISLFTDNKIIIAVAEGDFKKLLYCPCGLSKVIERAFFVIPEDFLAYVVLEFFYLLEKRYQINVFVNCNIARKFD